MFSQRILGKPRPLNQSSIFNKFVPNKIFRKGDVQFLPHCIQLQTRSSDENSVCPSVRLSICLSNACIVTKRKKDLTRFLYHTKDNLAYFSEKKNG